MGDNKREPNLWRRFDTERVKAQIDDDIEKINERGQHDESTHENWSDLSDGQYKGEDWSAIFTVISWFGLFMLTGGYLDTTIGRIVNPLQLIIMAATIAALFVAAFWIVVKFIAFLLR